MKKWMFVAVILATVTALFAFTVAKPKVEPAEINAAITKSLPLLLASSHTFLENAGGCHSCHGQGLGGIVFAMAKEKGFSFNDSLYHEIIDTIVNACNGARATTAESQDPVALVISGGYDLWALSANHIKSQKSIDLLVYDIMQRQTKDGNWMPIAGRPPLEYYAFSATALAVKSIQSYGVQFAPEASATALAQARTWLTNTRAEGNEEKVYQLLGLTWANGNKSFIKQQAIKLLAAQHADGGWSQLDSLSTDAYATGQSLYALNQCGQLKTTDAAYQKGIQFLLRTQYNDGSWNVQTRSYPSVDYVNSGFPHGDNQFISAAGTNWAVMALLLAAK